MTRITWDEFKASVERAGVQGTDKIWYIDVQGTITPSHITQQSPDLGWAIKGDELELRASKGYKP